MIPREELNNLICSKGIKGEISVNSSMFLQEVNSAMRNFESKFREFNYINF